ncbi:MAG: ABC transporter ATP-binding protein [Deltaproteobacteria bacterium]|nr:ABC transporter ATP-binding protein [Deltaproteobacteria bacterium]HDM10828.1 ABC transporter ATP-binding protein [Desulfobacteraceae bacterium]
MLEVKNLNTYYGNSHVLQDVSLYVHAGEVVALLGRNGVGKTTTLRSLMGLTPPKSGSIVFKDQEVLGRAPYEMAWLGLAYMPDDLRIFPDLTCEENLEIARRVSRHSGYWNKERIEELFPVLRERRKQKGANLSGGEKKMLSLGRALMANPEMILLDEPSEGLAPLVIRDLMSVIKEIRQKGLTILLADQNLKFCRRISYRGYILEKGQIVHQGQMEDIWQDEEVIKKYLAV